MADNRLTQEISINDLDCGMFVIQLDIPWIESPFLTQTRLINSRADIDKLRQAGVRHVVVDTQKKQPTAAVTTTIQPPKKNHTQDSPHSLWANSSTNQHDRTTAQIDLTEAILVRTEIRDRINSFYARIESNLPVDNTEVLPLIDRTLGVLSRDHQALLTLIHISRVSHKLVDHVFSTFCLSMLVGSTLGFKRTDIDDLGVAALLHDCGWMHLPHSLLGKRCRYTQTEQMLMRAHVEIGLKILGNSRLPESILRIIREHQEKEDGSGYPAGLQGAQLSPLAKVLAVVDHYDECIHQLRDEPGMLPYNALQNLYKDAERGRYSPVVVSELIRILGIYPVSTAVQLNTGEKAIVEQTYRDRHISPVVTIYYDADGTRREYPLRVDLSAQANVDPARTIACVLDPGNATNDPMHLMQHSAV